MTARGSQTLDYDAEGRLTRVKQGASPLEEYRYDADGALTHRILTPPAPSLAFFETFTAPNGGWTSGWSGSGSVTWNVNPADGTAHTSTLKVTGNGVDWTTNANRTGTIATGQLARVAFKLSQTGSGAVLALETTDGNSYFGVYEENGALRLRTRQGVTYTNVATLLGSISVNTWYVLELGVDDAAGMRASVWQEAVPGTRYEARWEMPRGQSWRFHGWAKSGVTYLDGIDTASGNSSVYREETPSQGSSDSQVVGKHYEYDYATNTQTKRYYAGGRLVATRSIPNANPSAQTLRYIQPDHLGSSTTLTDASGYVVARERYSAFGERRRGETPIATDQLYTGQRYNVLSSLYHYSDGKSAGRFYDPLLGRFVMPDHVTPGQHSQALNAFAYTFNNPLKHTDPDGNIPHIVAGAIIGGVIGGGAYVITHRGEDFSWSELGKATAVGGVTGAVGAATFGASLAVMGAATGVSVTAASLEAVGASAVAGVVSGQASRAAENFVTGQDLSAGLVDPRTMTVDAVAGAAGPALRAARGQVAPFVEGRITRNMSASIDDLVQDSNFLAMTARRQGSAIHEATENLMRLEGIRGLEFRPAVGNVQVRGQGGYPDYWFHPENRIWDLKTLNDPFPDTWKGRLYGELTGADVEAIRYDPWWR